MYNKFTLENITKFTSKSIECRTDVSGSSYNVIESAIDTIQNIHPCVCLSDIGGALRCGKIDPTTDDTFITDAEGISITNYKLAVDVVNFNFDRKCHIDTLSETITSDIIQLVIDSVDISECEFGTYDGNIQFVNCSKYYASMVAVSTRRGPANYAIVSKKLWDTVSDSSFIDKTNNKINGTLNVSTYSGDLEDKFDIMVFYNGLNSYDNGLIIGVDKIDENLDVWYDIHKANGWDRYYSVLKFTDK